VIARGRFPAVVAAWALWVAAALWPAPPLPAQAAPALPPDAVIRIASAGDSARHPVVLLLHGSGGYEAGRDVYTRYADRLASHGYDVYAVQYYDANDERIMASADRPARQDLFGRRLRAWIATVKAGIGDVSRLPTTDTKRIGLIGFSNGALIAVGTAGLDKRVGAVVELYGGMPSALSGEITRLPPTLILHGDADQVFPVERAYALERFLKQRSIPHAIHIYPGANHGFDADPADPAARDAERRAASFFDAQLKR
jgi:carboxymethylenebutenolidase